MLVRDELPLRHSNQYSADSACVHCDGVIRHESWCATQNANVHYAFQAVFDPGKLTLGDVLILHALGVVWTPEGSRASLWRLKRRPLSNLA
jgi:hypothetical protein